MNEKDQTMKYLVIGILIYFVVVSIPVLVFVQDKLSSELGLLLGAGLGIGMSFHMRYTISKSMYMEQRQALFLSANSIGRLIIVGSVMIFAALCPYVNVITLLVGIFGLKISAYIQPYFIQFVVKFKKRKVRM